jgi:hypothetical protein
LGIASTRGSRSLALCLATMTHASQQHNRSVNIVMALRPRVRLERLKPASGSSRSTIRQLPASGRQILLSPLRRPVRRSRSSRIRMPRLSPNAERWFSGISSEAPPSSGVLSSASNRSLRASCLASVLASMRRSDFPFHFDRTSSRRFKSGPLLILRDLIEPNPYPSCLPPDHRQAKRRVVKAACDRTTLSNALTPMG